MTLELSVLVTCKVIFRPLQCIRLGRARPEFNFSIGIRSLVCTKMPQRVCSQICDQGFGVLLVLICIIWTIGHTKKWPGQPDTPKSDQRAHQTFWSMPNNALGCHFWYKDMSVYPKYIYFTACCFDDMSAWYISSYNNAEYLKRLETSRVFLHLPHKNWQYQFTTKSC